MNRTINYTLLGAAILAGAATSCNDNSPAVASEGLRTIELSRTQAENVTSINRFSMDLFSETEKLILPDENYVISPLAVVSCLGILANCYEGNPRSELLETMKLGDRNIKEVNEMFTKITTELPELSKNVSLTLANALWLDSIFNYNEQVAADIAPAFNAQLSVSNSTSQSVDAINRWFCDWLGTDAHPLSIYTKSDLNIGTVVKFDGKWQTQFDKSLTTTKDFTNYDGSVSQVEMMISDFVVSGMVIDRENKMVLTELPYGNGAFSMYLLIPDDDSTIQECIAEFSAGEMTLNFKDYINGKNEAESIGRYKIEMPRFEIEFNSTAIIDNALSKCGMPTLSKVPSCLTADRDTLSALSFSHYVRIKVDEEGSKVVAVNGASNIVYDAVIDNGVIHVDHPFAFFIKENSTGTIIVAGQIVNFSRNAS